MSFSWNPFATTSTTSAIARKSNKYAEKITAEKTLQKIDLESQLENKKRELQLIERAQEEESMRTGQLSLSELAYNERYQLLQDKKQEVLKEIDSIQNKKSGTIQTIEAINKPTGQRDLFSESQAGLKSLGISNDNPFDPNYQGSQIPEPLAGASGFRVVDNPEFLGNQFTFGAYSTPVGTAEREVISEIRARQDLVREENQKQRDYTQRLRAGEVPVEEALSNPRTTNTFFSNGVQIGIKEEPINQTIRNMFRPQPEKTIAIKEERALLEKGQSENNVTTAIDKINQVNSQLAVIGTQANSIQDFSKAGQTEINQVKKQKTGADVWSPAEISIGEYAQGIGNTFESYYYLGKNVWNFVTGNPQEKQKDRKIPTQDLFFGTLTKSFEQSQDYNIPYDVALSQNWRQLEKDVGKKSAEKIAGELSSEAILWAIPVSPIVKGAEKLGKFGAGLLFNSDSIIRTVIEASSGTAKGTATATAGTKGTANPWSLGTYQNTNMFREKLPSDIFGLDTATEFFTTPFKLGWGNVKPQGAGTAGAKAGAKESVKPDPWYNPRENLPTDKQGRKIDSDLLFSLDNQQIGYNAFIGESKSIGKQFQGTRIELGTGLGKTSNNKGTGSSGSSGSGFSGSSGSGKKSTSVPPRTDNTMQTNNGLTLILQEAKEVPKTTPKTTTIPKQKQKKKPLYGSQYYLDLEVIAYPQIKSQVNPLIRQTSQNRLDFEIRTQFFNQQINPLLSFGQMFRQGQSTATRQAGKQNSKTQQRFSQEFYPSQRQVYDYSYPATTRPRTKTAYPVFSTPRMGYPFFPPFLGMGFADDYPDKDNRKRGAQGWFTPRVDPLGITTQWKRKDSEDGETDSIFKYWGTDQKQLGLGYFKPKADKGAKKKK